MRSVEGKKYERKVDNNSPMRRAGQSVDVLLEDSILSAVEDLRRELLAEIRNGFQNTVGCHTGQFGEEWTHES